MNELTELTDKQASLDAQQAARSNYRPIDKQAHLVVEVLAPSVHRMCSSAFDVTVLLTVSSSVRSLQNNCYAVRTVGTGSCTLSAVLWVQKDTAVQQQCAYVFLCSASRLQN
jgi:hypothetical protein